MKCNQKRVAASHCHPLIYFSTFAIIDNAVTITVKIKIPAIISAAGPLVLTQALL